MTEAGQPDAEKPRPALRGPKEELALREASGACTPRDWRALRAEEIARLQANGCTAEDWANVLVADPFEPQKVRHCEFAGLVRIGPLDGNLSWTIYLRLPVGLYHSRFVNCDLGANVAIHHVHHLERFVIGDRCLLSNIDDMCTHEFASFGRGFGKITEGHDSPIWLHLVNEAGDRGVLAFEGMIPADAYLWARHRGDAELMRRLTEITRRGFDITTGEYGTVGGGCVLRSCRMIRDVKLGPVVMAEGADKLESLFIQTTPRDATLIGTGVELCGGIVGPGCWIESGARATSFVLGANCHLANGARLSDTILGDNSTIECCEVRNSLIFPGHQQHHNNSFLIAACVMGQSNIAAGATVGSNHNSRMADGELWAGRGFWPGLSVSLKHNSRFASYTLLASGRYVHELDIPLPFSLVSNDEAEGRLVVYPAFWFLRNLYALARSAWKFKDRDRRVDPVQAVEWDPLAPDTAEEMLTALGLLERWTAEAWLRAQAAKGHSRAEPATQRLPEDLSELGRRLLMLGPAEEISGLEILAAGLENSRRKAVVLKTREAHRAYREMLNGYAVRTLLAGWPEGPPGLARMQAELAGPRAKRWHNLGGQLVTDADLEALKADIREGRLDDWPAIHQAYRRLWEKYPLDRRRHAWGVLMALQATRAPDADERLTEADWRSAIGQAVRTQAHVAEEVLASRKKDFDGPFRRMVFETPEEMAAVLGDPEQDPVVAKARQESEALLALARQAGWQDGEAGRRR